jgi:simple sugar transport system ATP-binding protein
MSTTTEPQPRVPVVALEDIWKTFGAVRALQGVYFDVMPGETHGLVGDNAAGKSTLMKILTGVYEPDRGAIEVNGKRVHFSSPRESRDMGIEMIFQHFALAENLDIRANIFLGREVERRHLGGLIRFLDTRRMTTETLRILKLLDLEMDPKLKVRRLSGGQRQVVAIGRALAFDARLVIMDEPTANLAVGKVEKLLELTKRLHQLGVAVIVISHRLDEIFAVADRITVMRLGGIVGRFKKGEVTQEQVSRLISHGLDGAEEVGA